MVSRFHLRVAFISISVIVQIAVVSLFGQSAAAESPANGLQISPALVQLNGDAGKSYTIKLEVLNVTPSDLSFTEVVNDFAAKDETGTPSIVLSTTEQLPTSIQSWVGTIKPFFLKSREAKTINAVITIPPGAEPGGHYGVIRFNPTVPSTSGNSVGLAASAGTLVLIRVSGNATEALDLVTFQAAASSTASPSSFFENGPITLTARFKNSGSVHVQPTGQIQIHDMFGNLVETFPVNSDGANVLPASIRRFDQNFNKQWLFGLYSADISVGYGTTGKAIVRTISFWVIPYKLVLVGLFILITLVFILRTLIKRYNKYIINQATKRAHTDASPKNKNKKTK